MSKASTAEFLRRSHQDRLRSRLDTSCGEVVFSLHISSGFVEVKIIPSQSQEARATLSSNLQGDSGVDLVFDEARFVSNTDELLAISTGQLHCCGLGSPPAFSSRGMPLVCGASGVSELHTNCNTNC
ncbi:hypothetical protein WMY93_018637 [Mugilogobius chulae]|uniref:Uncharacterized protein n=1 Tax=Mugilogobius chulae TaxID=88201 RepID=A0AAW0NM89_9GOBI